MHLYTVLSAKRKRASAKAFITKGKGNIFVSANIFKRIPNLGAKYKLATLVLEPLLYLRDYASNFENDVNRILFFDFNFCPISGGFHSQLYAIKLALSKTLANLNAEAYQVLSRSKFLTTDSRIKERKKYGLKKARKASQYSKR